MSILAAGSLRLQSKPGIGPTIAAVIQARLPELCRLDRRKLANLTGLAPHATESGQHRGKRRIWGGRADLTRALYLAGFVASRFDPTLRAYRKKLQAAGKPTKVSIIACARKLLTILAAMMRDQTDYGHKNLRRRQLLHQSRIAFNRSQTKGDPLSALPASQSSNHS